MIIERLQIQGFGRVRDQDLVLDPSLTVLVGPNEAGKSTVLHFVRSMLYGIPTRSNSMERYEPLHGGVHGGVLTAIDDMGSTWTISRFGTAGDRGNSSASTDGRLSIVRTDLEGQVQAMTQQDLERLLLGGVSREMFQQIFAISLTELQEVRTLQSKELSSYLFHAGIGGGSEIMRAERKLVQAMEKLYKPKGRVQDSARILQEMDNLEKSIAISRSYLTKYNEAAATLEKVEEQLSLDKELRRAPVERLSLLTRAKEIRSSWMKWSELLRERSALPEFHVLPEAAVSRWERLEDRVNEVSLKSKQLTHKLEGLRSRLDVLPFQSELAPQGELIERLSYRQEQYEQQLKQLQEMIGEEGAMQERLTVLMRQIDPDWKRLDMMNFSVAIGERESVRRYAAGFAGYDRRMESYGLELAQLHRQKDAADSQYEAASVSYRREQEEGKRRFQLFAAHHPQQLTALWNELQLEMERWREQRILHLTTDQQEQSEALLKERMTTFYRRLFMGSLVLTVVMPAILWLSDSKSGALASGLVLIGADLMLWFNSRQRVPRRRRRPIRGELTELEVQEAKIERLIANIAAAPLTAAGAAGYEAPQADQLEASMKELRRMMDAWQGWQLRMEQLAAAQRTALDKVRAAATEVGRVEQKISEEENFFHELEANWEKWLAERALKAHLSPEAVLDMFSLAEQAAPLISQLDRLAIRLEHTRASCSEYEAECLKLIEEDSRSSELSAIAIVALKKREWLHYQDRQRQRETIIASMNPIEEELRNISEELSHLQALQQKLLSECRVPDGETLRWLSGISARDELLRNQITGLEITMFSGMSDERQQELLELLGQYDEAKLEKEWRIADEIVSEGERRWNELQQQRGRLLQEKEQLEAHCMHDTAIQQLEEQRAALKELASEYAVLSICSELINRTRRIYEEERQPEVLRLASDYFCRLTGGCYTRIVMKIESKELLAEHCDLGVVESKLLSRGTAEQLYLAMRLALAATMNGKGVMPMLFDDLLVNFDEARMRAALSLIGEVAASRQVVMMTCHRYVAEMVQELIPKARMITWQASA